MSTSINHAYLLRPGIDPFDIRDLFNDTFHDVLIVDAINAVLAEAIANYDEAVALRQEGDDPNFDVVLNRGLHDYNRERENDLALARVVLLRNAVRGEVYAICYGGLQHHAERILTLPQVVGEFDYWDNTDGPAHLTEAAWADRALAWEQAIPQMHDAVGRQGLAIKLFSQYSRMLSRQIIQKYVDHVRWPEHTARVAQLAQRIYLTEAIRVLQKQEMSGNDWGVAVMRAHNAWHNGTVTAAMQQVFLDRAAASIGHGILTL